MLKAYPYVCLQWRLRDSPSYISEFSSKDDVALHILTHEYHGDITAKEAIANISREVGKAASDIPKFNIIHECIVSQ